MMKMKTMRTTDTSFYIITLLALLVKKQDALKPFRVCQV